MRIRELLQKREPLAVSLACLVTAGIWVWAILPRPPALVVTFLNVGEGDAIVVQTPSGRTVLVDCGPGPSGERAFDAGSRVVVPFLRHEAVNKLDALVVTHPHDDHIGGAPSVIANVSVAAVLDAALARPSGRYRELLEKIDERKIPHRRLRRGQVIDLHDGTVIEVLGPSDGSVQPAGDSELNNSSVVLRIRYGSIRFLLAGDADKPAEEEMLSSCGDLSANVLKVAHHGSSRGTAAGWIAAVRPQVAVISVGWKNQFGHPSEQTIARLKESGAEVYRTDRDGGITITTDGRRLAVATSR